jgi:hypothetical protein
VTTSGSVATGAFSAASADDGILFGPADFLDDSDNEEDDSEELLDTNS